ncbi:MAG: L-histidine N(alpha)-methyltransferase, partial [Terriglobus roseus]|nr:L-histidine N(alpha)-methyltransferase [Terriglobus roseus]
MPAHHHHHLQHHHYQNRNPSCAPTPHHPTPARDLICLRGITDKQRFFGSNLRKVNIILQALERAHKAVDYYALDLDRVELERTIADVPQDYRYVKVKGLHGTYDDGAEWLTSSAAAARPKCVISLGSSIGNFS